MSARGTLVLLAALALAPMAAPSEAWAATRQDLVYTSISGPELSGILAGMGITAELTTDSSGDPQLTFQLGAYKVLLVTYGCEAGSCKSVQLYAGFSMGKKTALEKINEWNRDRRFGRAYLDGEGDPVVEYDLDLEGGVSKGAIEEWVRTFQSIAEAYASHVGFN
jgi:hypothetical protein